MTATTLKPDPLAAAIARGAPPDELLDAADNAIERAIAGHDAPALEQIAARLSATAARLGPDGRGLSVAAARARASLPPPVEPLPPPATAAVVYAGWGRRVVAFVLDWIVLSITLGVLEGVASLPAVGATALWLAGPLAYFTLWHATEGATAGKQAIGIAVRRADGHELGLGVALGRTLTQGLLALSIIGFFVDSLWPLGDAQARALHDRAAGTIVVRTR